MVQQVDIASPRRTRRFARSDAFAMSTALALVGCAFVLPRIGVIQPLINGPRERFATGAGAAPLAGDFLIHIGSGTGPAILIAVAVILWAPALSERLPWRALIFSTWATAGTWAFALAMIDGWQRGFAARLTTRDEYLHEVPGVRDVGETVRGFAGRILDFAPDSWTTHVAGHPPGALLTFVWLDRIGLHGGAWAGMFCLVIGSSAAAAVVVTVRAVAGEATARRAAPLVAVGPTAIWVAVSADGYFAGVGAWGIALLAVASSGSTRRPRLLATGAGILFGWLIFCNYGLVLMALPAAAVVITAGRARVAVGVVATALTAVAAVTLAFAVAGFWWFDGYHLVQERYWQGIATDRNFGYWVWGNLGATVCAIGLGSVAGLSRVFDRGALRGRAGMHALLLAALLAIVIADVSGLSKAETERIWLPFTIWLTAAAALLPPTARRWGLAANVIGALLLNSVVLTNW